MCASDNGVLEGCEQLERHAFSSSSAARKLKSPEKSDNGHEPCDMNGYHPESGPIQKSGRPQVSAEKLEYH